MPRPPSPEFVDMKKQRIAELARNGLSRWNLIQALERAEVPGCLVTSQELTEQVEVPTRHIVDASPLTTLVKIEWIACSDSLDADRNRLTRRRFKPTIRSDVACRKFLCPLG